jgi:predicted alpha/beta superfamily hydrolase
MKKIVLVVFILLSSYIYSQTTEKIYSEKLKTEREIIVKLPASYESDPEKKYPLIFVLDSEFLFAPFEGNISYGNYWGDFPEVILVGINQNKKEERYDDSQFDLKGLPVDKGAEFFEFIAAELLPYLDKKYRIVPFKVIAGVDATAGFLNAFLYKDTFQFNAYISISPELAAGMEKRVADRLADIKEPVYYYQATADGDLKKIQKQVKELDQNIIASKNPLLNYKFDDFKGASHYSLITRAIPNALYQIFEVFQPITNTEYQGKIAPLKEGFVDYLNKKYETIESAYGIKMNVRLNDLKIIENAIQKNEAFNEYEQLAQITGQQFKEYMLYDYHMGMYWEKRKEYKKAINFYNNAFVKKEIAGLTKEIMINKATELKKLVPVKSKGLKGGKGKEVIEETPAEEPVTDTPKDAPTETPTEETKP